MHQIEKKKIGLGTEAVEKEKKNMVNRDKVKTYQKSRWMSGC